VREPKGGRNRPVRGPELWVLIAIIITSVALRVAVLRMDRVVRWDEPDYLMAGRSLFTGQGYAVSGMPELHYAPLFPIAAGLLYPVTGDMKLNSDICFVVFGTLALLPFYGLARRLFGARTAAVATAFTCVFPPLTASVPFWGTMLEPLYLLLIYSALYAVWRAWEGQSQTRCSHRHCRRCSGFWFGPFAISGVPVSAHGPHYAQWQAGGHLCGRPGGGGS